jgi:hypothetical protein
VEHLKQKHGLSTIHCINETSLNDYNYFSEVNTSSVLGLFKEIVVDHSICGEPLERNVVVVAACNPAGRQAVTRGILTRENDLGKEWTSGHYQVNELPETMRLLKWEYGALDSSQEREFIHRRMEMISHSIPKDKVGDLTELIVASHEAIRTFAVVNISFGLKRNMIDQTIDDDDLRARARSAVSLRDIQRVFTLFHFFMEEFPLTYENYSEAMYLTIAVVYYFKLDCDSRRKFIDILSNLSTSTNLSHEFQSALDRAMTRVALELIIPQGIALTTALKENIFMTVVCSLSFTPLIIVGPPGSSKVCIIILILYCSFPFLDCV